MLGFPQVCRRPQVHFAWMFWSSSSSKPPEGAGSWIDLSWKTDLFPWITLWCFYSPSWGLKCLRQCLKPSQSACLYAVVLSKGIPKCWVPSPSQASWVSRGGHSIPENLAVPWNPWETSQSFAGQLWESLRLTPGGKTTAFSLVLPQRICKLEKGFF